VLLRFHNGWGRSVLVWFWGENAVLVLYGSVFWSAPKPARTFNGRPGDRDRQEQGCSRDLLSRDRDEIWDPCLRDRDVQNFVRDEIEIRHLKSEMRPRRDVAAFETLAETLKLLRLSRDHVPGQETGREGERQAETQNDDA